MFIGKNRPVEAREIVIYSGMSEKRYLPYSLVFDLLINLNDDGLEQTINHIFCHTLPQRKAYLHEIDFWVDLECCGDITVIMAFHITQALNLFFDNNPSLNVHFILNSKAPLTRDNQTLLYFMEKYIPAIKTTSHLYLGFAVLANHEQRYLKWPCFTPVQKFDFGLELDKIIHYAWRCAELGAENIGFRLLEVGIKKAVTAFQKQLCLIQLQHMRIATQYYEEAAKESRVISDKYPNLRHSYYLTKAWGNILTRKVSAAGYYFECANVTMATLPEDLDSLYRMNIFALYLHLSGQTENAIVLEKKITTAMNQSALQRKQIMYINAINLARLYRAISDFEQAMQHYDIAFAARQLSTETDFIYHYVCYGMLYEKQARWECALLAWLKACLLWLAAEIPEALGWRAIRGIAQPDFPPRTTVALAKLDDALLEKMIFLCAKTNRKFTGDIQACRFVNNKSNQLGEKRFHLDKVVLSNLPIGTAELNTQKLRANKLSAIIHALLLNHGCADLGSENGFYVNHL